MLAFDKGALRETVISGTTGILVESEEQFYKAIRDDSVKNLDRLGCRLWAESRFTLAHMVDRYDQLLAEAVDGGW